jgi:hypothetical protein
MGAREASLRDDVLSRDLAYSMQLVPSSVHGMEEIGVAIMGAAHA